jgi:hypothetical protein
MSVVAQSYRAPNSVSLEGRTTPRVAAHGAGSEGIFGKTTKRGLGKLKKVLHNSQSIGALAQLVEQRTLNPSVECSSHSRPTREFKQLAQPTRLGFLLSAFR